MNFLDKLTEIIYSMENNQGIGLSQFKNRINKPSKVKKSLKKEDIKLSDLMRRTF